MPSRAAIAGMWQVMGGSFRARTAASASFNSRISPDGSIQAAPAAPAARIGERGSRTVPAVAGARGALTMDFQANHRVKARHNANLLLTPQDLSFGVLPRRRWHRLHAASATCFEPMDQTIASFASQTPRSFLRGWLLTVLIPGLVCGGFAVAVVSQGVDLEDWNFVFVLGTPVLYWFAVGLLQGRLLQKLIERPKVWIVSTWGGGSLALIGGFTSFAWLTMWIDEISHYGFEPDHPIALLLFGLSGVVGGLILGFLQAVTMHASWRERGYWLAWSATGGCLAFLVLWGGVNLIAVMSERNYIDFPETGFYTIIAACLLAGALTHNLLTGIALQRMLAKRARRHQNALVIQFD
jgi:hypothetical protein